MQKRFSFGLLAVGLAFMAGCGGGNSDNAPVTLPHYTVTEVSQIGGGQALPVGVNGAGDLVGSLTTGAKGNRAVLVHNGVVTDLGDDGHSVNGATALNDAGQIAGTYGFSGRADSTAFFYNSGQTTTFGPIGGVHIEAHGLNASGQVVGISNTGGASSNSHAFVWQNGTIRDLGTLPGDGSSEAHAINASGQIVGQSNSPISGSDLTVANSNAVVWQSSGQIAKLPPLLANGTAAANGINDAGQIVGYSTTTRVIHATLWQNGSPTDLGAISDLESASFANAINNAGLIVGYAYPTSNFNDRRAFVYVGGKMRDLNALVSGYSGPTLQNAIAIGSGGKILATNDTDNRRTFLLTPQ